MEAQLLASIIRKLERFFKYCNKIGNDPITYPLAKDLQKITEISAAFNHEITLSTFENSLRVQELLMKSGSHRFGKQLLGVCPFSS